MNLPAYASPHEARAVFDGPQYARWRWARVNKLVSILGADWFDGRSVIEFGAAYGGVGRILTALGADVTFAEGRPDHCRELMHRIGADRVLCIDNDAPWRSEKVYDLALHWGLLYHLTQWREDLKRTLACCRMLSLDSEVLSGSGAEERLRIETGPDQSMRGIGTYMTASVIEAELPRFCRYDDPALNSTPYRYDWEETDACEQNPDLRRFWMVTH